MVVVVIDAGGETEGAVLSSWAWSWHCSQKTQMSSSAGVTGEASRL